MCIHFYPFKLLTGCNFFPNFELGKIWGFNCFIMSLLFPKGGKAPNELPSWVCRFVDGCCVLTCFFCQTTHGGIHQDPSQDRISIWLVFSMWTSHRVIDDYYHLDFEITACGTQTKQSGSAVDKVCRYLQKDIAQLLDWIFYVWFSNRLQQTHGTIPGVFLTNEGEVHHSTGWCITEALYKLDV